jgi:hypothetical protein
VFVGAASAQAAGPPGAPLPPETVQWHVALSPTATLRAGQRSSIELTGKILEGWHVYGLKQHPDGPTELQFRVDDNQIVQSRGAASGSEAIRRIDRGFGFEIEYYTNSLQLTLPIEVKHEVAAGKQQIPVSVRFQSCSERICLPPTTVHLLVDIDVQPHV